MPGRSRAFVFASSASWGETTDVRAGAAALRVAPGSARAAGRRTARPCRVLARHVASLLLAVTAAAAVRAGDSVEASPMYFEHLTVQDGLSQSTVNVVFQDSQGFIWLGTESGLNRYDGHAVVRYQSRRDDSAGLRSDYVWDIEEDAEGNLWIATDGGGVARWLRDEDRFQLFPIDRGTTTSGGALSSDSVRALALDGQGTVWIGTRGGGLNRLHPGSGRVDVFRAGDPATGALASDEILSLLVDSRNRLWVGTTAGLHRYDAASGNFIQYAHDPQRSDSLSDDTIIELSEDAAGSIWVGTFTGGLNRLVEGPHGTIGFERHLADESVPGHLSHNYVRAILSDRQGRLWVGTAAGLNLFDPARGTFSVYAPDPADPHSLADAYVMSLYEDRTGLLWVGTRSGGVSHWNPRSWSMGHHAAGPLGNALITAFAAEEGGRVWVGSMGAGLARLDVQTGRMTTGSAEAPLVPGLQDARTMSLLLDAHGSLWIGTMTGGLHRHDPTQGTTVNYRARPDDPTSLGANGITSLLEDPGGRIWVGTYGGGVSVLDRTTDRFRQYRPDPARRHALSGPRVTTLAQTPDGSVWVGTDNMGLNRYDPALDGFHVFRSDVADAGALPSDAIFALHVDDRDRLWLGTARGDLLRVRFSTRDPADVTFEAMEDVSLMVNAIYGIQSDAGGRLWLATNDGLLRFDPTKRRLRRYRRSHGLQADEFNFGAHHRGPDGMLYFGGVNGLNAFFAQDIEDASAPPEVVFTAIKVMNSPAQTARPAYLAQALTLTHTDAMVTFEFAALDYTAPRENRYEYRLQGFDREWNPAGALNQATYTNLDAGHYVFQVRGANSDGIWSAQPASLAVRVLPPPWATPWARVGYALVMVLLVLALLRWQRLRNERRAQLLRLENFNQLTGLPNRKLFLERLGGAIDEARRREEGVAVLHVDLDKFKRVNDTLGQAIGDEVIRALSLRMAQEVSRSSDGVGRRELAHVGGDEFVAYVRHLTAMPEAERLASALRAAIGAPLQHAGQEFVVTASVGIAAFPDHGDRAEELFTQADTATFNVKQDGGDAHLRFTARMNSRATQRFELENDLRNAIRRDELELYFQPKFCARTFQLVGAESLLRWRHPKRGFVSPAEFIPIAEESGLIGDLGHFVSYAACQQVGLWQRDGLQVVPVAINLSAADFHRNDPVETLRLATDVAAIDPALIEVEITESMLFHDLGQVAESLARLRELGCTLTVDDFGTGYSSLGYLRDLPLDALKIDRQFVADIAEDAVSGPICEAIIGVAHSLGLRVIGEGIEREVQVRALQRSGCDEFQGFLLARPLTATQFEYWLANRRHPLAERCAAEGVGAGAAPLGARAG